MIIWYILIILVLIVTAVMLMRLRVRAELSGERRLLFVGLGRSGPELDFVKGVGTIRLAGITVRRFSLEREPKKPKRTDTEVAKGAARQRTDKTTTAEAKTKRRRVRGEQVRQVFDLLPTVARAFGKYFYGMLTSVIVEQAEGYVEAGFDEPHLTGQMFGYYQAVVAAVPAVSRRFALIPNWTEATIGGQVQVAVAIPLYQVVVRTMVLVWRLPKVRIYRLIRQG